MTCSELFLNNDMQRVVCVTRQLMAIHRRWQVRHLSALGEVPKRFYLRVYLDDCPWRRGQT